FPRRRQCRAGAEQSRRPRGLCRGIAMTVGPVLRIDRLSGGYGSGGVVRDVSLSVGRGEVVCLLGRDGLGKSALAKVGCGLRTPAAGKVQLGGHDVTGAPLSATARLGLTYCPQERVVFDDLTVAENLTLMRSNRRLDHFAAYFEVFPRLGERRRQ